MNEVKFIAVMVDSSNHINLKIVPVLVRYYLPEKEVQIKVLEVTNLPGEKSSLINDHILKVLDKFSLTAKIVAFSADNTNSNFGEKVKKMYLQNCNIGLGCGTQVIHNAFKTAVVVYPSTLI